jgi:serine/threonine protein kinase
MLRHRKAVASSTSEWHTLEFIKKPHVTAVEFGASIMERFRIRSKVGVVKALELSPEEASSHALRRAVTIMERGHHPNIVRMLAATRQNKQVHIILELEEYGSLTDVLNHFLTGGAVLFAAASGQKATLKHEARRFFLALACQVLCAVMFLHEKLGAAHRDINTDHALIAADGRVRLCGFAALGQITTPNPKGDMGQVSAMLHKILRLLFAENPAIADDDLTKFATDIETKTAFDALSDSRLTGGSAPLYNHAVTGDEAYSRDVAWLAELFATTGGSMKDAREEMRAWKQYDERNPSSDKRHLLRSKMKDVISKRTAEAIKAVFEVVKSLPKRIAQ